MSPEVSIIMPVFNAEAFVAEAIESVLAQTHKDWELIIIDDASTDASVETITPYTKKFHNIKLLKNTKNFGTAITRNKGTETAQGHFIAFLDADDVWLPQKLEKQLEVLKTAQTDVCFSSYKLMDETGKPLNKIVKALPVLSFQKLLKSNYVGNLTGIYNAKALGKITTKNLKRRQDWLLWLTALKQSGKPAIGIQEPLALYRVQKQSVSSNKFKLLRYNFWVFKKGLGFSTVKSTLYFLRFLFEQFFVKARQTKKVKSGIT